ncbi:MAG TPA: SAM-dependent methyltransferase [Candidatus Polarisedimenticolaceae bacterium]|nr:SAM-dependent methyltransferase [Candidatus Polarisedimenticolaceae bacterium]
MADSSAGHPELLRRLAGEIRAEGSVSFARFMEIALHDPDAGYYARGPERLGRGGDFFTASDVGPAFGEALARLVTEMDDALGRPEPFRYVEYGAGRGMLARDVLEALPAVASRVAADLVDASPGMRAAAAAAVPSARVGAHLARRGGAGVVVAVELFDALPVHRVRRRGEALVEVRVAIEGDRLVEAEREADAELVAAASRYGSAPEDGDEAEVCLALPGLLASLSEAIERGFLVVVDYGHEAELLRAPAHRRGTLLAYRRHAVTEDYLDHVGEQDLTAHVNLTHLTDEARALGFALLRMTTQDRFLIANGILEGLDDDSGSLAATKRRLQAKQLLHPGGMGTAFKVAVFAKSLSPAPDLKGLRDPFETVGGA